MTILSLRSDHQVQPKQGFKYNFCHCSEFNNVMHPARPDVLGALGLDGIQSVPVHHCHDAWGVVIKALQGWKIVYSGVGRVPPDETIGAVACLIHSMSLLPPPLHTHTHTHTHNFHPIRRRI